MSAAMLRVRYCALAFGVFLGLIPTSLHAVTLHVALNGNDAWSGSWSGRTSRARTARWPRSPGPETPCGIDGQAPLKESVRIIVAAEHIRWPRR